MRLYLVVVSQHPAQAYCVLVGDPVPEFRLGGQNAKLGLIISVLETVLVESHLKWKSTNLSYCSQGINWRFESDTTSSGGSSSSSWSCGPSLRRFVPRRSSKRFELFPEEPEEPGADSKSVKISEFVMRL